MENRIEVIPHSVSDEEIEEDGWLSSDDDDKLEYTIEYFGNGQDGEPEGECLIVSPMTFQLENDDEYYSDQEYLSIIKKQAQQDEYDEASTISEESISDDDLDDHQLLGNEENGLNEMEDLQILKVNPMKIYQDNSYATHKQLLEYKEKYEQALRQIEETVQDKIAETAQTIQEAVNETFNELQEVIHTQEIELDMEKSLRESAETENETLKSQIIVMKKQIEEDEQTFSEVLKENEQLKHKVKVFRERNVALKQIDFERQKEIQRLKGDITLQQLEYRDMIEENKIGKKKEEVFKLEKQKLATQKKVLSRELDIHFYRNSITGNSYDKTSIDSMKDAPVNYREKELEKDVQIFRKRMELLQPNLDVLNDLYLEQIANMKELVSYSKKLSKKLEDETTTKIELRKSIKRDFETEHLRMEYQRLTRYDSDDEEFDVYYNEQEKLFNRQLREKDKQLQIFRVAFDNIVDKTEERRQVLETELANFLTMVKDLQKPITIDEDEIIETLLKRTSLSTSLNSKSGSSPKSILSSGEPKSFMISRFQKDAVKGGGRQRSQSYSDFGSRNLE